MDAADSTIREGAFARAFNKLSILPLSVLMAGSMIGCGVFSLSQNMAKGTSPGAIATPTGFTVH